MANNARNRNPDDDAVEPEIPVSSFIENASHAVPVSGLLADQPELVDALLPRSEWDALLEAYLTSPRP